MSENPYAAPSVESTAVEHAANDAEAIRKQYLSHEASVKSIGTLYLLGALFLVPIGVIVTVGALTGSLGSDEDFSRIPMAILGLVYLGFGILQAFTAFGLRKLRPWARIVATIFAAIGLIGFPIGTLISGYFLYLLLSQKGSYVFSEQYQKVIEATPHIKYRTSIIVIVLLVLLVLLLFMGMMAFLFSA